MKEDEILKTLRTEAELHTPDVKSRVLSAAASNAAPQGEVLVRTKKWLPLFVAAMCIILAAAIVLAIFLPGISRPADTFKIVISINPSAEFTVQEGTVSSVRPLNRDAAVLLKDENLSGLTAEGACMRFAELADGKHLIGADGIRLHGDAGSEEVVAQLRGSLSQKFVQYSVTELDENSYAQLFSGYNEQEMGEFEDWLEREFEDRRTEFEQEIFTLLQSYEGDLDLLDLTDAAAVSQFNLKYIKLGDDLTFEDGDESKAELLNEYRELSQKLNKNPERVLDELYGEFLDELEDVYEDYVDRGSGSKDYDDVDDDDDEDEDEDDDDDERPRPPQKRNA